MSLFHPDCDLGCLALGSDCMDNVFSPRGIPEEFIRGRGPGDLNPVQKPYDVFYEGIRNRSEHNLIAAIPRENETVQVVGACYLDAMRSSRSR